MNHLLTGLAMILVLAGNGCAASTASAEGVRPSSMQAVLSLLAAEEHVASAEELSRIGPEVPDLLIRIAQDREQDIAYRARATSYLGYYQGNPTVEPFLSSLVTTPDSPTALLRRGLLSLARVSKGKAIPTISPHLKSQDTLVREAAARALAETDDAAALDVLRQAASQEREPYLRQKMYEIAEIAAERSARSRPKPEVQEQPDGASTR